MVIVFLKVLSIIPHRILYFFSDCVAKILTKYDLFSFQSVAKRNLSAAFPQYGDVALKAIESKYYCCCGEFLVQFLKSISRSKTSQPFVRFVNIDALKEAQRKHKAIICYSGHFLNYEVTTLLPEFCHCLSCYYLYHASKSKKIDDFIKKNRAKHGAILISNKLQIRRIFEAYNPQNTSSNALLIGSLADHAPKGESLYRTKLFGLNVSAYNGTEKIGKSLDACFFYAKIFRLSRGEYEVKFVPMSTHGSESITDCYFRHLEQNITMQPEIWLLWGSNRLNG